MWGMSQPGTVGKSSLREILCVCVCVCLLGKGGCWRRKVVWYSLIPKMNCPRWFIFTSYLRNRQMAALEKSWVLFLFCFVFSLKGGPADENKLWNDLCLCNWLDCVMLRPWNRNSRAARQGIYLGGIFLGKSGERENNNTKKKPGGGGVCDDDWPNKITNDQPLRLKL